LRVARTLTIPNALSALRIVLAPVLVVLAALGEETTFLTLLAISLASDALDGYLARLLHQTSELGVKLDSWGDLFTYVTMIVGLWLLWPQHFAAQKWFLLMGVGFYCLPMLASLFKFGVLPRFHTWAAKAAAVLIAPAYYILALWGDALWLRLVICFHMLVALEVLMIVFVLNRIQYNVPSFIHARNLSRRARRQLQLQRERLREKRTQRREVREEQRRDRH